MISIKSMALFLLVLLSLFASPAIAYPLYHLCGTSAENFTSNSTYSFNLNFLLTTLSTNASAKGFAFFATGRDPDRVYGLTFCRGDTNIANCSSCISTAMSDIHKLCLNNKVGAIWYDYCQLFYANQDVVYNPDVTDNYQYVLVNPNKVSADNFLRANLGLCFFFISVMSNGAEISSIENRDGLKIDFNHSLFLHPSDTPSSVLVSQQLIGIENYTLWSRSMKIALLAKNKRGFIDGSCKKESFDILFHDQWERCNAIVLSWIMNSVSKDLLGGIVYSLSSYHVWEDLKERFDRINGSRIYFLHREITTLNQGVSSVSTYFSKLKLLWDEYGSMVPLPVCSCESSKAYQEHTQQQKLLQFLLGLNETYNQAKSQILMMNPLPTVNQAYSMLIQEENQRQHQEMKISESPVEISGLHVSNASFSKNNSNPTNRFKKNWNVECEHCHLKGHKKESCYKLIGYPADFKFTKRKVQGGNANANVNAANNISSSESNNSQIPPQNHFFTADQYEQILKLLQKNSNVVEVKANSAGNLQWHGDGDWNGE